MIDQGVVRCSGRNGVQGTQLVAKHEEGGRERESRVVLHGDGVRTVERDRDRPAPGAPFRDRNAGGALRELPLFHPFGSDPVSRLERILGKFDNTMQLMTRAIIRLLERHDADMATQLSKELYMANGDDNSHRQGG